MNEKVFDRLQRERGAGGFPMHDGTIEFYGRIRSLLEPGMVVLDFGAGRGAWVHEDTCSYRKQVRDLRDASVRLIGCDVDQAILNKSILEEKTISRALPA